MTNKKVVFGVIIVILVVVAVGLVMLGNPTNVPAQTTNEPNTQNSPITPLSQNASCEEMYEEIEKDLENSNYCEQNTDCDVIMLGSNYIKFGCYHYINKNVDEQLILQKMGVYDKKGCSSMINKCAPVPEAQCAENKCVRIKK